MEDHALSEPPIPPASQQITETSRIPQYLEDLSNQVLAIARAMQECNSATKSRLDDTLTLLVGDAHTIIHNLLRENEARSGKALRPQAQLLKYAQDLGRTLDRIRIFIAERATQGKLVRLIKRKSDTRDARCYRDGLKRFSKIFAHLAEKLRIAAIKERLVAIHRELAELADVMKREELRRGGQREREHGSGGDSGINVEEQFSEHQIKVEAARALLAEEERCLEAQRHKIAEENGGRRSIAPPSTHAGSQDMNMSSSSRPGPPRSQNWSFPDLQTARGEFTSVGGNQDTYSDSIVHTNTVHTTINVRSVIIVCRNRMGRNLVGVRRLRRINPGS